MQSFHWVIIAILIALPVHVNSSISDYLYKNSDIPSFSNYGSVGLIQMPTARFHEPGSLAFNFSHNEPYINAAVIAYPFSWFEASYQYTDINNYLYSQYKEFSGGQSFKDKSFDAKFRLLAEQNILPAVAVGFRDIAGTGIFSSEYIVASKKIKNFDYSIGMGWGALSGGLRTNNPFSQLSNKFDVREYPDSGEGGEFSPKAYFSGSAGVFGGLEFVLPLHIYLRGLRKDHH